MTRDEIEQQIHLLFDTPDRFRAWLDRKSDDDKVGVTCQEDRCPLATFARDKGLPVLVGSHYFKVDELVALDEIVALGEPEWVKDFIYAVDEEAIYHDDQNLPVSARQARQALAHALDNMEA